MNTETTTKPNTTPEPPIDPIDRLTDPHATADMVKAAVVDCLKQVAHEGTIYHKDWRGML